MLDFSGACPSQTKPVTTFNNFWRSKSALASTMVTSSTMALSSVSPPQTHTLAKLLFLPTHPHNSSSFPTTPQQNFHQNHTLSTSSSVPSHKWRTHISFFPSFLKNKTKEAKAIKEELLEAIAPLDRGAEAAPDDQERVDQIVRKLEAINPTKEPLKSDLLDGKWELIYTTSESILQTKRPKILRSKVNYQGINVDTLRAQNMESWPFFNQVTADLTPVNSRKVAVKFDYFKIAGLIPVKAPETAVGALEITYLDEDLRISRGDKGNLFILKMVDPSYRVPT